MSKSRVLNPKFIAGLTALYVEFAFAGIACAVGGAAHGFSWSDLLWPVINFSVLAAVLVFFLAKPVREFFRKRTELIEKSIRDADEAKALAQKTLDEVKVRLRDADREMDEILDAARRSGEKEKQALIDEGKRLSQKIIEQASANIEFELQKAKEEIKSEAALMALQLAEQKIKDRLGKKEQDTLIDAYIKKLEARE